MFYSVQNTGLTTLKGIDFPKGIIKFHCSNNQLINLEGCPEGVVSIWCFSNRLISLSGCPNSVQHIWCSRNQLTSLNCWGNNSAPPDLVEIDCFSNRLTSLVGCPPTVAWIDCRNNPLINLEGLPYICRKVYYESPLPERNEQELEQIRWRTRLNRFKQGLELLQKLRLHYLVYSLWHNYWYDQRDEKGHSRACKYVAYNLSHR